jgi:hypothetical protein
MPSSAVIVMANDSAHEHVSFGLCMHRYGHYARFAMLLLMTAVISTDEYDSEDTFRTAFISSSRNHSRDPRLAEFMNNFTFEFSDFFTTKDIRILLQVEM